MPIYEWRNKETGEIVEVPAGFDQASHPPDEPGEWERVYSVAVKVEGGTAPARGSSKYGREKS